MQRTDTACYCRRSPDLSRLPMAGLLCAVGLLTGVALAWAQSPSAKAPKEGETPQAGSSGTVQAGTLDPARQEADRPLREGSEIVDQLGSFKLAGERALFITADGARRWCSLENLNLERIVRVVADAPEQLEWTVTGTITEYRGNNYLLIHRASLRNRAPLRGEGPSAARDISTR